MNRSIRWLLLPLLLVTGGLALWRSRQLLRRVSGRFRPGTPPAPSAAMAGQPADTQSAQRTTASPLAERATAANTFAIADRAGATLAPADHFGGNDNSAEPQHANNQPVTPERPAESIKLAPRPDPDPGQLDAYGDDETTNDRVLTRLGRYLHDEGLGRLNINTQAGGVVFLRGTVRSQAQVDQIWAIVEATEGVGDIVSELQIEEERGG